MKKLLAATLFAALSGNLYGSAALADPPIPAFYQAASQLKAEGVLGQVVAKETVATSLPGAAAWRIAYVSSDLAGRKTLSTALVVAPSGPAPAEGRPVLAWAHGTTGTAENCGPSQVTAPAVDLNQYFLMNGNSWTDYGLPAVETFIKQGYVVVGTDYQGLGAGGRHQYAVAATQARDVINSIRAAGAMKETGAGHKAIVYGWSQGGGATIAVASLPDYLAEKGTAFDGVDILGFVALAPYDTGVMAGGMANDAASAEKAVQGLATAFSDNVFNFTHFAMNMWGTEAAFPDLHMTDLFTADGAKALDQVFSNKCMHPASDTLNYAFASTYKTLMNRRPENAEAWAKALVAGSVAPVKPLAPVVIYWGTADTVVPPVMGAMYRDQMCKLGGQVERHQLAGEQTHFSTPGAAEPFYLPWIADRLAGKPVTEACQGG